MNKTTIPDYRQRQHLLYMERFSEKNIVVCGDLCLEAGMIADALECYLRANHRAGLEKIRDLAETAGDVMIYQQTLKALNQTATPDDWDRIGRQAFAGKKYSFSLHAFEKSENSAMIEEIKKISFGSKEEVA